MTSKEIEEMFRTDGNRIWRAVLGYADGERAIADDAVSEAFAKALVSCTSIRNLRPWLYTVAFRHATAELAARRKSGALDMDTSPTLSDSDEPELLLVEYLRVVSPRQKVILLLHYQGDLSVREIAETTGASEASVKVELHRGRQTIKAFLESTGHPRGRA